MSFTSDYYFMKKSLVAYFHQLSPILFFVCALLLYASPLTAEEKESSANTYEPRLYGNCCLNLAAMDSQNPNPTASPRPKQQETGRVDDKKLFLPMTEEDLLQVIKALKPVRARKGEIWGIRAVVKGSKLSFERLGLLVGDATTLLVTLDTQTALRRMKKDPEPDKKMLAWMENAFKAVDFCARRRFEGRGGKRAYEESFRLVEKYRNELEPVILNHLAPEIMSRIEGK